MAFLEIRPTPPRSRSCMRRRLARIGIVSGSNRKLAIRGTSGSGRSHEEPRCAPDKHNRPRAAADRPTARSAHSRRSAHPACHIIAPRRRHLRGVTVSPRHNHAAATALSRKLRAGRVSLRRGDVSKIRHPGPHALAPQASSRSRSASTWLQEVRLRAREQPPAPRRP
ncbi:MAG: hypothetical protein MZV64_16960 [Ignavibacteriales bacterium]|nr:hypothetical protein [Ignavibacteriales bacterium]